MESIRSHLQITTINEIGAERTARTVDYWKEIDLLPKYISSPPNLDYTEGFTNDVFRKILGVAGCLQAHRKAWEVVSQSDEGIFLISEDDCVPAKDFLVNINEILQDPFLKCQNLDVGEIQQRGNGLLIQIGWTSDLNISIKRFLVYTYHLFKYRGPLKARYVRHLAYGTHCYLLNPEMARFLIANISSNHIPIDLQFISLSTNPNYLSLKIARTIKNLSHQEGIDSNIENLNFDQIRKSRRFITLRQHMESLSLADCSRENYL